MYIVLEVKEPKEGVVSQVCGTHYYFKETLKLNVSTRLVR